MNFFKIVNFHFILLIFALQNQCADRIKLLSLSKKAIDNFYSKELLLFNGKADNKKSYEMAKMRLEMSIFGNEIEWIFKIGGQMALSECQKQILSQKRREFDTLKENITQISHQNICELWKLWRDLEQMNVTNQSEEANGQQNDEKHTKIFFPPANRRVGVNCEEMGKAFADENGTMGVKMEEMIRQFWVDLMAAHLGAILLAFDDTKPMEEEERGPIYGVVREKEGDIWEFSNFFGDKQLEHESDFAYHLRILRIKNDEKSLNRFSAIKNKIQHITMSFFEIIELTEPILMGFDVVDDAWLSRQYVHLISDEKIYENFLLLSDAEKKISMRIYFGRIWYIFVKIGLLNRQNNGQQKKGQKIDENVSKIRQIWDEEKAKFIGMIRLIDEPNALVNVYKFWRKLVNLYNKVPSQRKMKRIEPREKCQLEGKDDGTIEQIARDELFEEHLQNMGRLYGAANEFGQFFKTVTESERKKAKFRIKEFCEPKNRAKSVKRFSEFAALAKNNAAVNELLKIEMNGKEIARLQIKNYLKYLDNDSDESLCNWAKFHLHLLAYYQWFQTQMRKLPRDARLRVENDLAAVAVIWVDCENEFGDGISESEMEQHPHPYLRVLEELKRERFPNLARVGLMQMHRESAAQIIGKDGTFWEALKTIVVNKKRAREMFGQNSDIAKAMERGGKRTEEGGGEQKQGEEEAKSEKQQTDERQ